MSTRPSDFAARCYALIERIPPGQVTTYAEIARALNTRAWRAVGTAMAKNNRLITVPCHRVVRSTGEIGEYALGTDKKGELLAAEGVSVRDGRVEHLEAIMFRFVT